MICGCDFHFQAAYLEPENRAVQGAVPEEAEPAGVRGHIAADLASALGAEVKRHGKPMLGEEGVQGLQDAARLVCVTKSKGRLKVDTRKAQMASRHHPHAVMPRSPAVAGQLLFDWVR